MAPCRLFALAALSALFLGLGCAGPPIPAPIEGIPVCPDFVTGNARMEGGLRFPVRLRVLEGKTVLFKTVIDGLRHPDDPTPKTYIIDDNATFKVEWAQCSNPHAPRSVAELAHSPPRGRDRARDGEGAAYDCGEAVVYKDGVITTRKGDRASHALTFVAPPDTHCWVGEANAPPPAARDAGAEPAPGNAADAGPAAVDAGAAIPPAADAGAAKKN